MSWRHQAINDFFFLPLPSRSSCQLVCSGDSFRCLLVFCGILVTSLTASVYRCQERKGCSLSALRDLCVLGLLPKEVGVQHALKPSCSTVLSSVSQSCAVQNRCWVWAGQFKDNRTHRVYSQGECDPSCKGLVRLLFGYRKGRIEHTNPLSWLVQLGPGDPHIQLCAVSLGRWEQVDFTKCLDVRQAHTCGWAFLINSTVCGSLRMRKLTNGAEDWGTLGIFTLLEHVFGDEEPSPAPHTCMNMFSCWSCERLTNSSGWYRTVGLVLRLPMALPAQPAIPC